MTAQIGTLIKKARTAAGMTQADLAKIVGGVTASDISKAERGIEELSAEQLKAIAEATGVEPEFLMDGAAAAEEAPFAAEETASNTQEEATPETLSDSEKELLALYRSASAGSKKAVMFVLKGERQLLPKLKSMLAGLMKNLGENGENPFAKMMGGGENGANPVPGMIGGLMSMMGSLVGKMGGGENPDKQVSGSLLAFTYFYSVSIYILLLSFYFWQWRTDIKPEK